MREARAFRDGILVGATLMAMVWWLWNTVGALAVEAARR